MSSDIYREQLPPELQKQAMRAAKSDIAKASDANDEILQLAQLLQGPQVADEVLVATLAKIPLTRNTSRIDIIVMWAEAILRLAKTP